MEEKLYSKNLDGYIYFLILTSNSGSDKIIYFPIFIVYMYVHFYKIYKLKICAENNLFNIWDFI